MKKQGGSGWGKVVISGMGVMGASLGYSLVKENLAGEVFALVRRPEICRRLVKMRLAHRASADICEAVTGADMVILAVPASAVGAQVRRMLPYFSGHTVVSDLCSVKQPVIRVCEKLTRGRAMFLSVHPMTGTEKFGYENFIRDLYRDMPCILTPSKDTDRALISRVQSFWNSLGAKTLVIGPYEHDVSAALISHLPHVIAFAYFSGIIRQKKKYPDLLDMAAGSFRDITRIAASSPELWADIFINNRREIIRSAALFRRELDLLLKLLRAEDQSGLIKKLAYLSDMRRSLKIHDR